MIREECIIGTQTEGVAVRRLACKLNVSKVCLVVMATESGTQCLIMILESGSASRAVAGRVRTFRGE